MNKSVKDIIVKYYKNKSSNGISFNNEINGISCYNKLGEAIMLSSIPEKAKLNNKNISLNKNLNFFLDLVLRKNIFFEKEAIDNVYSMHYLVENFNYGNGNILQQIYRACGLEVDIKPKGNLYINKPKIKNRIGIHIDGASAGRFHGSARDIYQNNIIILQNFINNNPQYNFIQFGQGKQKDEKMIATGICHPINENKEGLLDNVEDFLNKNLEETLEKIAECEYFICLNSGFYHAAIALDIKTICIINLPSIEECYLPILVNEMLPCTPPYLKWDKNWLYPQAVHLHQDGENELVKLFNSENLKKALNGDIYPFWKNDYLNLINEI
jgi:hypothetical protein